MCMGLEGSIFLKEEYAILEFNLFNKHCNVSTHQILMISEF